MAIEVSGIEVRIAQARQAAADADRLDKSLDRLGRSGTQVEGSFARLRRSLFSLQGAFGALGIGLSARELINFADAATNVSNRLRLVTSSTQELAQVQDRLFNLAQATRSSFEGTADLYGTLARNAASLNLEQDQLFQITESVNKSIKASGASAQSASAGLLQFSQALGSGVLQGDELRSLLENLPSLARSLAAGLNVPIGKLKELGAAGELTAEQVVQALLSQSAAIDEEFGKTTATVADAFERIQNSAIRSIGRINEQIGGTRALSAALNSLADNMDLVIQAAGFAALALSSKLVVSLASATAGMGAASTAATVLRGALALLGGPAGIAITVAGTLAILATRETETERAARLAGEAHDELKAAMDLVEGSSGEVREAAARQAITLIDLKQKTLDASEAQLKLVESQIQATESLAAWERLKGAGDVGPIKSEAADLRSNVEKLKAEIDRLRNSSHLLGITIEETGETIGGPSAALIKLRNELDKVSAATDQYNERISLLKKELEAGNIEQSEFNKLAGLAKGELDKVLKGANAASKSIKNYADEQKRLNDELTSAVESLDPLVRAANDYNRTVKILSSDLAKAELGQDRVNELLAKAKGEFLETAENIDKTTDSLNKSTDAAVVFTKEADPFADAWNRSIEDVSRAISDGLVGGFKDAASTIKSIFSSLLSSLVNLSIRNKILIPMGLAPGSAMAGGFGGGGFNPGSLFGLSGGATTAGANPISPMAAGGLPGGGASSLPFSGNLGFLNNSSFVSNPLTSGIGGFAGNLGANALLGGNRGAGAGIGGTIGAIGGSFLPLPPGIGTAIGSFVGNAIGGLFGGGGKSSQAQGGTINLATGGRQISGLTGEKFSQENADLRTNILNQAQQFSETLSQVADEAIQGSIGVVVNSRRGLELYAEGTKNNFGNDVDALLGAAFDSIVRQSGIFSSHLENMIANFRGSNEQLAQFATSLATIQRYTKTDPFEDFTEALLSGTRTLYQQALVSRRELIDLARSFDGSLGAANELAAATQSRYQVELALLQQIDGVARGISSSFADTREQIERSVLGPEELFNRLAQQAESFAVELQTAIDPQRIGELAAQINKLTQESFGLLDESQRQGSAQGFISFLDEVESLAGRRLDASRSSIAVDRNAGISGTVSSELSKALNGFETRQRDVLNHQERAAIAQREAAEAARRAAEAQERAAISKSEYYAGMGGR